MTLISLYINCATKRVSTMILRKIYVDLVIFLAWAVCIDPLPVFLADKALILLP